MAKDHKEAAEHLKAAAKSGQITKDQLAAAERIHAVLRRATLEYEVERYEKRAREILKEEGYPADWDEMSAGRRDAEAPSRRAVDAEDILFRARHTLKYTEKNESKSAAWNAILMTRAAMRADLPEYDKALVREYQSSNAKKKVAVKAP